MKKILYISHVNRFSGGEVVLLNLLIGNNLWDSTVFVPGGKFFDLLNSNKVKVIKSKYLSSINRKGNFFWPVLFLFKFIFVTAELMITIKKVSPDIIHSNNLSSTPYCIIPKILCRKKLVWHMHDIKTRKSLDGFSVFIMSLFSDKVIAVSNAVAKSLYACGVNPKKVEVCHNAVDEKNIIDNEVIDSRYFIKDKNKINIAQIGLIEPRKGTDVFVDAIKLLMDDMSPVLFERLHFFVIGEPLSNEEYLQDIHNKIRGLGLEKNIIFCGRLSSMKTVYENLDVLVVPSVSPEPFGMVIIEAMIKKCAVIASDIGGIPEIIDDKKTGLLFEPGSSQDLANKLRHIIVDNELRENIRTNAITSVKQRFSMNRQLECIENIYNQIVA